MKKLSFILSILCFLLSSCTDQKNNNSIKGQILYLPEYSSITDTVDKIFDNYRKYLNTSGDIIYQIFIDQNPDSITIYLTFIQYYVQLEKYCPTGYVKMDEDLFLLYSGINNLFSIDTMFFNNLQDEISLINLKDKDEVPTLFENRPWSLTFYQKNKNFVLNKRASFPYTTWDYVVN